MSYLGQILGIVAGVISFSAYFFYIAAIIRGETKPSRTTWFILAFISIVILASYDASGAEQTIWVAVANALASVIIAVLSIKKGVGGSSKLDLFSFFGSLFSLVLWWYFDSALVALLANLIIDFLALLPTLRKSWYHPELEDRFAWLLTLIGNTLNLLAIDQMLFSVIIYPIYFFLIDGFIVWLLYRSRRHINLNKSIYGN